jgi:hypothetical protein
MNIEADCHLRINEVTDCGCVVTAIVRTDTAVPVRLDAHPVFETLTDRLGDPYESLAHYAVDLRIGDKAAADVVPANSSVELWVPQHTDNTACELPAPGYAYLVLRHLVDGVKAMPWQPCPEHEAPDDRRPGDILAVISADAPGIRPEYTFHDPKP